MTTPMRRQYLALKRQYPDVILFFRLGDFYETFDDDAKIVSEVCDVVLTSRPVGNDLRVPLAGVPYHAIEGYVAKLLQAGYKVAIADQQGNEAVNGLVPREVRRIVTPGTIIEPTLLDERRNNYLAAITLGAEQAGLAYCDITTGEFSTTQIEDREVARRVQEELGRLQPAEIVIAEGSMAHQERSWLPPGDAHPTVSPYPAWHFDVETARQALLDRLQVSTLVSFGCEGKPFAIAAAGAIIQYLADHQPDALRQITGLRTYTTSEFMALDEATRRNLELTQTIRTGTTRGSLLGVLDHTRTPMGGRLLRRWLGQPLLNVVQIEERLDAVEACYNAAITRAELRDALRNLGDLERWTNRAVQRIAQPRDLVGMRQALSRLPAIREMVQRLVQTADPNADPKGFKKPLGSMAWHRIAGQLDACEDVRALLENAIADEPPATTGTPGIIRPGFSPELDGIHARAQHARAWVANLERVERERTGIKSLKVGYNKVFGYYIEVTNPHRDLVPPEYIRKQTLTNAERYITPELKEYESLILNAEERLLDLETQIYRQVMEQIAAASGRLLATAQALAELDVYLTLAEVAAQNRYVRPTLSDDTRLDIVGGRHPVVELMLKDTRFVPNDTHLSPEERIVILTGPNMSGKCLRSDTLVFSNRGLLSLEDLRPGNAKVGEFTEIACHVQGMRHSSPATHIYAGGKQRTFRLTTRLGYHLEGTPEHRVWVRFPDGSEGWKRLAEIAVGDVVAIQRQIDLWGQETVVDHSFVASLRKIKRYQLPDHLDEDLAYLMGLLVGDGILTYTNSFLLSTADAFIADEFRRIVKRLFGYEVGRKANGKDYFVTSKQIRAFLAGLGLGYSQAHEKSVPRSILRAPRHIVVAFLQGLFDTDGYAENRYGNVRLSTASSRLAQEVQLLLLNLGLITSIHVKQTPAKPSYQVSIDGADAIAFHQLVGFRLPRKQALRKLASPIRRPNVGGIPYLRDTLKQIQARIVATDHKPVALKRNKRINSIFYSYIPNNRNISYAKLDELITYCHESGVPCPELESLQAHHYFYDRIAAIEPGEADVYDLCVPGDHAYVANGFISHNSTYLRQAAIIVLMAQIGSFVPAESAHIGLVDRIFTRIGAQDEIYAGQSTFMVEMVETANILHHATSRSLLILDEIGRGTSTYDGLAIAWAVVEYIHNHPRLRARTLFATHYHELTDLAARLPQVVNYNVTVAEEGDDVVFLHKIERGAADRSYGVHVARLAGLPPAVVQRA